MFMSRNQCSECLGLVAGFNGTWICGECSKPCAEIKHCPASGEVVENIKKGE